MARLGLSLVGETMHEEYVSKAPGLGLMQTHTIRVEGGAWGYHVDYVDAGTGTLIERVKGWRYRSRDEAARAGIDCHHRLLRAGRSSLK